MQATRFIFGITVFCLGLSLTSCRRDSDQVWEDGRSATRHVSRGFRTMGGKYGDSRAVQYRDDFMPTDDSGATGTPGYNNEPSYQPTDNSNGYTNVDNGAANGNNSMAMGDFVPLSGQNSDDQVAMANYVSQQPRETPGDPGSSIPGISAFQDPSMNPQLSGIFRNVTFEYNSNLVKGQVNLETIHNVANYMRSNPNCYVFVAGHCDERGPEAYNLALGSRRSNAVRNLLLQEGVNPDNVFTISYGKEQPMYYDHNEECWEQNRRGEFKVYQR